MRLHASGEAQTVDGNVRPSLRVRLCAGADALFVDGVVGVSQQDVGEAGLQQVHGQERRLLDDHVQQQVDRLSVTGRHLVCFLTDLQQTG